DPHDEKILFFGYVTLALAAYAVWLLIRRRESLPRPWRMPMTVAAISAPIAFLLSLPRTLDVFGVAIPTPTYALGVFTSFYRVYARVGYVVGIAAALLAAAALARL